MYDLQKFFLKLQTQTQNVFNTNVILVEPSQIIHVLANPIMERQKR